MQARNWGWSRAKKLHKVKFLLYKICVPAIQLGVPVQNYDDGVIRRVRTNLQNFVNSVHSVNPGWVCLPSSDCVPDTSLSFLVEFYIPWALRRIEAKRRDQCKYSGGSALCEKRGAYVMIVHRTKKKVYFDPTSLCPLQLFPIRAFAPHPVEAL